MASSSIEALSTLEMHKAEISNVNKRKNSETYYKKVSGQFFLMVEGFLKSFQLNFNADTNLMAIGYELF